MSRVNAVVYYVDDNEDPPSLMRATRYDTNGEWQGRPLASG